VHRIEDTLKEIIHAVRRCRLLRTMTLDEAKALCLALTESRWPGMGHTPSGCAFTR
jgi:hypothetical protein